MAARTGAAFSSFTTDLDVSNALVTPSLTRTVTAFVLGPGPRRRQVNTRPTSYRLGRRACIQAERQALRRNIRVGCRGRKGQQRFFRHRLVANGRQDRAAFSSFTTIWMVSNATGHPSLTRTVTAFVLGPWASVGVQVNTRRS